MVIRLRDGVVLIDDSYNSSPRALARALETVAADARASRKVAVIGEMLELGAHALSLHREAGRTCGCCRGSGCCSRLVERLPVRSPRRPSKLACRHRPCGMSRRASWQPIEIVEAIRPGDLVLVKGSRGTRTDIVADRIATVFV